MKIHEYQAKAFLEDAKIPTPQGTVCNNVAEVKAAAETLGFPCVIKAQVHAGGRGKAGGVKLAKTVAEAETYAKQILGMDIKGSTVHKVLVAQGVKIATESYVGLTADRVSKTAVLMVSAAGGIDIEEVAEKTPEKILKINIDPALGIQDFQCRQAAYFLYKDAALAKQAIPIIQQLSFIFFKADCSLIEINPLITTSDGKVMAIDSKINFDDNALFRHPKFEDLRDMNEENADELDAKAAGLSYIELKGKIGCIVNGAGLAMATMDIVKLYGGEPANFLDVGGSSNPDKVVKAFQLILKNPEIKSILINIFGGITRCDDIAKGIIEAKKRMSVPVPVVVRLTGTNEEAGRALLVGTDLISGKDMDEAVKKAVELSKS